MTDATPDGSPFDLEPQKPEAPAPAPAPAPSRRREPSRGRTRAPAEAAPATTPAPHGRVFALIASPRSFYVLSGLMTVATLFAFFNPYFGGQDLAWFWDSLRTGGTGHTYAWNPTVLQAYLLPLLALAFFAAALSRGGPTRGWWISAWVLIAFVAFQLDREQLQYLAPLTLCGVTVGVLIRRRRGPQDSRVLVIVALALGSFLFLPTATRTTQMDDGYVPEAVGLVQSLIDGPEVNEAAESKDNALTSRLKLLLYGLPRYVILILFILLLLALVGLDQSWMAYTAASLLLIMLAGMSWVNWDLGTTVTGPPHVSEWKAWYGGATETAVAWRARFLPFLPALAGCVIEIGRLRRAR